jgi:uncharacterized membrane protein YqjE
MTDSSVRGPNRPGQEQSVGALVSQAIADVSELLRCELDLAKAELKEDVTRGLVAGASLGMAGFAGCLVLVLLCFADAYGLMDLGVPGWASFLIVAGNCIILAILGVFLSMWRFKAMRGLPRTRRTVAKDISALRRRGEDEATPVARSSPAG